MVDANGFHKGQEGVLDGLSPRDGFTDRVSAGGAPRAGRVVRALPARPSSSGTTSPASPRAGSRGRSASSTPRSRNTTTCRTAGCRSGRGPTRSATWTPGPSARRTAGPYLEQHTVNDQARLMNPIFLTGDPEWERLRRRGRRAAPVARRHGRGRVPVPHQPPLLPVRVDGGQPGPPGGAAATRGRRSAWPKWRELGEAAFPYDTTAYHRLRVENRGAKILAYIDDRLILSAEDDELPRGKAGRHREHPRAVPGLPRHRRPTRRSAAIDARIARREAELAGLREPEPAARSCGSSSPPRSSAPGGTCGSATSTATATPEMLIAQNIPRIGDNFVQISCLTAVTLDGRVLWQLGRPDPRNGLLTSDTPVPDPRPRRRRPERGRDGQGLQAPGPRGRDRARSGSRSAMPAGTAGQPA